MNPLIDELTNGPLAAEIAPLISARNDVQIAEVMNRKDIPIHGAVPANLFAIWAGKTGLRASIEDHASNSSSPLRSVALILLDLLRGNLSPAVIDLGIQDNVDMLNAWVSAGALTEAQRNGLMDLSIQLMSRADQIGRPISANDITCVLNEVV